MESQAALPQTAVAEQVNYDDEGLQVTGPTPSIWHSLKAVLGTSAEQLNPTSVEKTEDPEIGQNQHVNWQTIESHTQGSVHETVGASSAAVFPESIPGEGGPEDRVHSWRDWRTFVKGWMKDDPNNPANQVSYGAGEMHEGTSMHYADSTAVTGPNTYDAASMAAPSSVRSAGHSLAEEFADELLEQKRKEQNMSRIASGVSTTSKAGGKPKKSILVKGKSEDEIEPTPEKPKPKFEIVLPSLHTGSWEHIVHQVVWRVGRHFGFQAFNMNPKTKDLVSCQGAWNGRNNCTPLLRKCTQGLHGTSLACCIILACNIG